jgi:hypothetical protein
MHLKDGARESRPAVPEEHPAGPRAEITVCTVGTTLLYVHLCTAVYSCVQLV